MNVYMYKEGEVYVKIYIEYMYGGEALQIYKVYVWGSSILLYRYMNR